MERLLDWLTPALGTIIAALITFIGTQAVTRRKTEMEGAALHVAGVNAATKLLIDSLFQQIATLTADLATEKAGRQRDRQHFERRINDLLGRLPSD